MSKTSGRENETKDIDAKGEVEGRERERKIEFKLKTETNKRTMFKPVFSKEFVKKWTKL